MNFGEAVNSALIKKYATFKGRACRAEWWYFLLFSFLVIVFAASVAVFFNIDSVDWKYLEKLNTDQATEYFINSDLGKTLSDVYVVLTLALFIPGFAEIGRAHV